MSTHTSQASKAAKSKQSRWLFSREGERSVERAQCAGGGCICPLYQDQEFSLAHERPAFSRQIIICCSTSKPIKSSRSPTTSRSGCARSAGKRFDPSGTLGGCSASPITTSDFVSAHDMLVELHGDNRGLVDSLRAAHEVASKANDYATTSLIEVWIDEAERRAWFLFEATR